MKNYDYDVALSFAGEDRSYVEKVAEFLYAIDVKVFYDRYEEVNLWGKNLYIYLDEVYQRKSRYCVVFISKFYKEKLWANHESQAAFVRAFQENIEYLLPVRFDETELPGLRSTIGYIDLKSRQPDELGYLIAKKLEKTLDLEGLLSYLRQWLKTYEIDIKGSMITFKCNDEDFYSEYPIRLLLDMYRLNELDRMFLMPAIVPW